MTESQLSYFNLARFARFPTVPTGGSGFRLRDYGKVPLARDYTPNPAFTSASYPATALSSTTLTSSEEWGVPFAGPAGWLYMPGLKSATPSGLTFEMHNIGDQHSPGNAHPSVAGRQSPVEIGLTFTFNAAVLAYLWKLLPRTAAAPSIPQNDTLPGVSRAYRVACKGRILCDLITPDGSVMRTLGTLTLPSPFDAPADSAEMTVSGSLMGSGRPAFFDENGVLIE